MNLSRKYAGKIEFCYAKKPLHKQGAEYLNCMTAFLIIIQYGDFVITWDLQCNQANDFNQIF